MRKRGDKWKCRVTSKKEGRIGEAGNNRRLRVGKRGDMGKRGREEEQRKVRKKREERKEEGRRKAKRIRGRG